MKKRIEQLLKQEAKVIQEIPIQDAIEDSISVIYKAVHRNGGKLVVSGMGKAGQIGYNIAMTLASTGTPAVFLHPSEAQHGDLGIIQKNDILLVISNSGKTREILELIDLATNLYPLIGIVAITGNLDSELSERVDVVIGTGNPTELCPLELTPTASTTAMTVIGDLIVVLMMEMLNFTKEEYAKRHHGGYLGKKAKE